MPRLKSLLMRFTPEAKAQIKGVNYNFVVPTPALLPDVNDVVLIPGLESLEFVVVRRFWEFGSGEIVVALLLDVHRKTKITPELRAL